MPPSFHTSCPGCLRVCNTPSSYWQHLAQSRNPLCCAVFQELQQVSSSDSEDDHGSTNSDLEPQPRKSRSPSVDNNPDTLPEILHKPELIDNHEQTSANFSGSELDADEQRQLEHDLEDTWEPEHVTAAEGGPDLSSQEDMELDTNSVDLSDYLEDVEDALIEEYRVAGQRADVEPRVISYSSRHPRSYAGSILKYETSTDVLYHATLNEQSNIWAPFSSEADWKIAKWAKLRSAGSTSFTELLAVDGVRHKFTALPSSYLMRWPFYSFVRQWVYRTRTQTN